jgi:hypothetical protein
MGPRVKPAGDNFRIWPCAAASNWLLDKLGASLI